MEWTTADGTPGGGGRFTAAGASVAAGPAAEDDGRMSDAAPQNAPREVVIYPDFQGGGFTAVIPSLPGCVTQGETVEEAAAMAGDAAACYVDGMTDLGRPIPVPAGGSVIRSVRPQFLEDRTDQFRKEATERNDAASGHADLARQEAAWEDGLTAIAARDAGDAEEGRADEPATPARTA